MRMALFITALIVVVVAACSPSPSVTRTGGTVTLVEPSLAPDPFVIDRGELNQLLGQGPARFIQRVAVRPVVSDGIFFGFQLLSLFPERDARSPLPIRVGDIVQTVNGMSIERPDQFMSIWASLAHANQLSVRIIRNGEPLLVTWAIRDLRSPALGTAVQGQPARAEIAR